MSTKRSNLFDDPPNASSEEDEELLGDSSSDDEEVDVSSKTESVLKTVEKNRVSDSESGSDEESDHIAVKKQVPSGLKPIVETHDSKKVKSLKKRSSSEVDGAEAKKVKRVGSGEQEKKSSGGNGEETKKTYFQRVWTQEDEIVVLQRIIDHKTETGVSPLDDTNAFYQLVKDDISFDVSKIQFSEKLRSLKKKFDNNLGKGKNGEEPTFSKPHDQKAFDLSKVIWGANGIAPEATAKSVGKSKKIKSKKAKQEVVSSLVNGKNTEDDAANGMSELDALFVKSYLAKSLARVGVDDLAAQQAWTRLSSEDRKGIEEQWKAMQLKELEFYSDKSCFIHEVVTKMTQALRSNP